MDQAICDALKAHGFDYPVAMVGIPGPGNWVVVFASLGDFHVACVNYDNQVLWCHSCGMTMQEKTNG